MQDVAGSSTSAYMDNVCLVMHKVGRLHCNPPSKSGRGRSLQSCRLLRVCYASGNEARNKRLVIGSFFRIKRAKIKPDSQLSVTSFVAHVCCYLKGWLNATDLCLTNTSSCYTKS